jgi:pyruvate dehydrogenase E1 component beta subunit
MAVISYREALNQAMREEMARDPRVFVMGEEVGQYNGAYKVTQGLLKEFGPWRVVDTPIAELGFAGVGVGAAMDGLRPIIEVMTWNFALLAMDQIVNSAAKMRQMSGGQLAAPVVFRGPQGAAHQLAAQHSQVFEAMYAQVPGLKVAVPATPRDAKGLLKTAVRMDDPVVFMESEVLYGSKGEVEEGELLIPFGEAEVVRPGRDVTLVAWQKMRFVALSAAQELAKEGIEAEVIDPRTLRPFDLEAVLASVRRTNRCVVVEEGWPWMGSGAQIADSIQRHAFDDLDAPVARVTGRDVPMPYAKPLENVVLPSVERVRKAVLEVTYRA